MKRHHEREFSPLNKRSREIPDNQKCNDKNDKRNGRNSPVDDKKRLEENREYYRSLCVRNLHSKLTNDEIENILSQEYNQFGEFNVKVAQFNGERVAYINFKYPENARSARYTKPKPIICDRQCPVDPVLASKYKHGPGSFDDNERNRRVSSPHSRTESDKKDKFPHHLFHIEPEDDPKATRTLFVGNLAPDIEDLDLRDLFEKFGSIEDIDIKRPVKGINNNSYAFVKYANLDMAHKAKVLMSGKIIKSFQCKIGYGKVTPTKCLWVGGLGPWVQYDVLETAFSHFGVIQEIDWPLNKNYAYILFENIEAAVAACEKLRGFKLGDGEKRIRVDFTEETHIHNDPGSARNSCLGADGGSKLCRVGEISLICGDTYRFTGLHASDGPHQKRGLDLGRRSFETATMVTDMVKCMRQVWTGRFFLKNNYFGTKLYYLRGEEKMITDFLQPLRPLSNIELRMDRKLKLDYHLLDEVCLKILAGGDVGICIMLAVSESNVDSLQELGGHQDPHGNSSAHRHHPSNSGTQQHSTPTRHSNVSTQQPSTPTRHSNVSTPTHHSNASTTTQHNHTPQKSSVVKRHLKALSAYLRIKQAAGKVILQAATDDANGFGTLHVFPPCGFSHKLLVETSPLLTCDYSRDDFLLLILVRCY